MTTPNPTHTDPEQPVAGSPEPDDLDCPVCPHPWADHDVIGRRFCTAKISGGSAQGCACTATGKPPPSPRS